MVEAYQAGERRVGVLALHATGATDFLVRQAESVNRLNEDVRVVFSDAPFAERLPHAVHLGIWATGTAAQIVGVGQMARAGIQALRKPASPTLATIGPRDDPAIAIAEQALENGVNSAPAGYYDVLSHGTPYRMMGPEGQSWTAREVAQ